MNWLKLLSVGAGLVAVAVIGKKPAAKPAAKATPRVEPAKPRVEPAKPRVEPPPPLASPEELKRLEEAEQAFKEGREALIVAQVRLALFAQLHPDSAVDSILRVVAGSLEVSATVAALMAKIIAAVEAEALPHKAEGLRSPR